MAVNDELQRVDTVEKTLWDKIVNLAESFTDDDINTLASLIENAGGGGSTGGVLVVDYVYDEDTGVTTLDKTWKEIRDADFAVIKEIAREYEDNDSTVYEEVGFRTIDNVSHVDDTYYVNASGNEFKTDSENGYPYRES